MTAHFVWAVLFSSQYDHLPGRDQEYIPIRPSDSDASNEEIAMLLAKPPAISLMIIGFGGIVIILWLMMFKPF